MQVVLVPSLYIISLVFTLLGHRQYRRNQERCQTEESGKGGKRRGERGARFRKPCGFASAVQGQAAAKERRYRHPL